MAGPIDYSISGIQDPTQAFLGGVQQGQAIQQLQLQRQAQQAAQAREMQIQSVLQKPGATPDELMSVIGLMDPKVAEQVIKAREMVSKEKAQGAIGHGMKVIAALESNPELGVRLLNERADMMEASNMPNEAAGFRQMAERAKTDPVLAANLVGSGIVGMPGSKEAFEALNKLREERRATALAPAELRTKNAKASTAEVEAKNAEALAGAKLKQMQSELGLTNAQVQQALSLTKKYDAETKKLALEAASGNPEKQFDFENKLRVEYTKQAAPQNDILDNYRRIKVSQDNAVGDLSLIFGYMKMLDPGSVVREGEFANAQNAAGVPERILNAYNRAMKGERLTSGQRASFLSQAEDLKGVAERRLSDERARFAPVISAYKLDERNVFGAAPVGGNPPAPAAPSATPKPIKTEAEYTSLPSGATYIAPDGSTRTKR